MEAVKRVDEDRPGRHINVTIPESVARVIEQRAAESERSISAYVRYALRRIATEEPHLID